MTFDTSFPLKLYLNLTRQDERRREVENELLDAGIEDYERIAAFPGKWAGSWRGYPSAKRYAQALSHKRAVWTGWRRKAAAVVVFEDDVVLAPGFKEAFDDLELPDDWGIFFFGCQHRARPTVVASGVVRCALTRDMHAYAVRASAFREVARALTPFGKRALGLPATGLHSCGEQLGGLCDRVPVYAAWPNLAWQRRGDPQAREDVTDPYTPEGRQTGFPEAVAGLDEEMRERFGADRSSRVTVAKTGGAERERLLFCGTSEDVGLSERLRGLASLRLLAKLRGQTACLWWPEGMVNLPGLHDEILEPTGYRCVSDEREWRRLSHGVAEVERAPCTLTPEAVIDLARQRGLTQGYTHDALLDLWRRLARDVRPSRIVHSRVTAAVEGWQARRPLGVHVSEAGRPAHRNHRDERGTPEPESDGPQSECGAPSVDPGDVHRTQELTPCRERVLALLREADFDAVFLACDDPAAEREWIEWLGGQGIRVLGSNRVWRAGRVRERSIEDEAVDLFLLSRCDLILATAWSDFSWMASVVGGVPYCSVSSSDSGLSSTIRAIRGK